MFETFFRLFCWFCVCQNLLALAPVPSDAIKALKHHVCLVRLTWADHFLSVSASLNNLSQPVCILYLCIQRPFPRSWPTFTSSLSGDKRVENALMLSFRKGCVGSLFLVVSFHFHITTGASIYEAVMRKFQFREIGYVQEGHLRVT